MFDNNWDPYERIIELERFAKAADQHIANLLKNQQEMVKAFNSQSNTLNDLKFEIAKLQTLMEEMKNETAGKK
jgi:glycerol-3-phosphate responsive antiterminator